MKAYKFKLAAVLKLRKIKEEKCRTELGQLISQLNKINFQIEYDSNQIQKYFDHQEFNLKNLGEAAKVQLFPRLIESKQKNIKLLNLEKNKQERLIEIKKNELAKLKAELKIIEKLKEKDFDEYKKNFNREMNNKIEEQTQIWINTLGDEE